MSRGHLLRPGGEKGVAKGSMVGGSGGLMTGGSMEKKMKPMQCKIC